nr:hypothetical protein [Colwellia sp.]
MTSWNAPDYDVLSELVKEFEEKFGVSAAPVVMSGGAEGATVAEENTKFNVVLVNAGPMKFNAIKVVRT